MKLALLIPVYGMMPFKFAQCLANLIAFTKDAALKGPDGQPIDVEVETFMISSSSLCASRHRLVSDAYLWGADYMLWMDSDHVFPRDAFCRLWARNKALVGCNYARRSIPTAPTACAIVTEDDEEDHRNLVYTSAEKAQAGEMEPVSHLGFGLCLMHRSVIDRLQARAEELGRKSFLPLFVFEPCDDHSGMIGEDVYFFRKVRDAGFPVFCDHALSWEVGHIHEMIMTNAHASSQREEWIEEGRQYRRRYSDRLKELEGADG